MRKTAIMALALIAAFVAAVPAASAETTDGPGTIVDIVLADDGEFDVLQAAVVEADLVDLLSAPDPKLRVFAPTDAAFVATFEGILGATLSEADVIAFIESGGVDAAFGSGALVNILAYHVTAGHRDDVLYKRSYLTLNGDKVSRHQLLDAGVGSNVEASNGVINILSNSVLIP